MGIWRSGGVELVDGGWWTGVRLLGRELMVSRRVFVGIRPRDVSN